MIADNERPVGDRAPDFETSIGFLLSRLGVAATRSWTAVLTERELSPHQHAVLLGLRRFGPVGLTELAGIVLVDARNLGPVLEPLEQRGFLVRLDHPTDRRRRTVNLTSAGEDAAAELAAATDAIEDELLEPLGVKDRDSLRGLLLAVWTHQARRT